MPTKTSPSPSTPVPNQPPVRIINTPPAAGESVSVAQALASSRQIVDKAK